MGLGALVKLLKPVAKYGRAIPRYAFGEGYSVISRARKGAASGYTIFQNPVTKSKAGFSALKADVIATVNKPSRIATAWRSGVSASGATSASGKFLGGLKGLKTAFTNSIKTAWQNGAAKASTGKILGKMGSAGKFLGGMKGVLKPLCKMPVIASLITLGIEAPDIYSAFKEGGLWEGTKQLFKSGAKIVGGTVLGALGTAVGGPVGGVLGYALGEQLVEKITGPSYNEAHENDLTPAEQQEIAGLKNSVAVGADNELTDEELAEIEGLKNSPAANEGESTDATSTSTDVTNPFNTQPTTNPYQMNGGTLPTYGDNIFTLFPTGVRFQYLG